MRKHKETTSTSIVFAKLVAAMDFMTVRQLVDSTGVSCNRVTAALCNLRNYKAADFIADANGTWWYATPESDTRTKTVEERVPETKPRKPRSSKPKNFTNNRLQA